MEKQNFIAKLSDLLVWFFWPGVKGCQSDDCYKQTSIYTQIWIVYFSLVSHREEDSEVILSHLIRDYWISAYLHRELKTNLWQCLIWKKKSVEESETSLMIDEHQMVQISGSTPKVLGEKLCVSAERRNCRKSWIQSVIKNLSDTL